MALQKILWAVLVTVIVRCDFIFGTRCYFRTGGRED